MKHMQTFKDFLNEDNNQNLFDEYGPVTLGKSGSSWMNYGSLKDLEDDLKDLLKSGPLNQWKEEKKEFLEYSINWLKKNKK